MIEINVSKCESYCNGICEEHEGYWEYPNCEDRPDCYYKQLQQLQRFKQENEEIRKVNNANAKLMIRLRDCLDKIEEIAKNGVKDDCGMPLDELSIILKLIKQAKEK